LTLLYFDCFSGASGDMILGALLDAGLPLDDLRGALGTLAVDGESVWTERVMRAGITATKFQVRGEMHGAKPGHDHAHHHHSHRTLSEISKLIDGSALSAAGKERAKDLFAKIGEAEAAIHGTSTDKVHLHEVGALDSIIDIVGTVYALETLGIERIVSSPLNVGSGTVRTEHGLYPVPAPATARLLQGAPIYSGPQAAEMVTPTGALLVTSFAESFGPVPAMRLSTVGYGAGSRDLPDTPNVLRVLLGDVDSTAPSHAVTVIEADIDDMNPQIFGALMDRLLAEGALDVYYTSIQMKKNRPGTLLTIVAAPEARERLTSTVFRETTTIGVRYREMTRECLDREKVTVETPLGPVRFKVAKRNGEVLNASPEFDDCARIAAATGTPIKDVQSTAMKSYLDQCAST
jgi:uncharacterized protein (TIGR00299 family) protein